MPSCFQAIYNLAIARDEIHGIVIGFVYLEYKQISSGLYLGLTHKKYPV